MPCNLPLAAALFSAQSLGIMLWVGLAVLSLTLLVLMRTRWGQTKPLSKCVGLSVFAHILFGGYAWGTKLVFDVPQGGNGPARAVRVNVIESGDEHQLADTGSRREALPWEKFAAEADPTLLPPTSRSRLTDAPEMEEPAQEPPPKFLPSPADLALAAEPERPKLPIPEQDTPKPSTPAPSAAEIEIPQPEKHIETDSVAPTIAKLPRASTSDLGDAPQREQVSRLPSDPKSKPSIESSDSAAHHSRVGTLPDVSVAAVSRATNRGEDASGVPQPSTDARSVPRRSGDGDPLPSVYESRVAPDRLGTAKAHGGNAQTEAAVESALLWLATNQNSDGRWDASRFGAGRETKTLGQDRGGAGAEADTGITGLALLAFLAAGHTHLEGKYRTTVQHGLEFLLRSQRDDGYLAGRAELFASMYCHGMASLALSEAFAMTGDERLRPGVERAVRYTVNSQHSGSGGWRYQPAEQGDMSQFGWQVMALKSAELAGIAIPERTKSGMTRFLRSVSSGRHRGLNSYRAGEGASRPMTAEGLACRIFLNVDREPATLAEGADFVIEDLPKDGKLNLYYWYYGTLALYQLQDVRWERWNAALQEQLLKRQRTDGDYAGSFDTDDLWGGYGGRVYTTAIATLSLEVYYRYLPLVEKSK